MVGGKEIPGTNREIGAYIANLAPAGTAELSGKVVEGKVFTENLYSVMMWLLTSDDSDESAWIYYSDGACA